MAIFKIDRKPDVLSGAGMKSKRGISMIELIIVMTIIALGAVVVTPNIGAWITNFRLRTATRDVVSAMRTAQIQAVSNNVEYRVRFPNTTSFILERNAGGWVADPKWVDAGGNPLPQTLPAGVQFSSITFGGSLVQFNPNATSSAGSVTLQNSKGMVKRIAVASTTGRIKIGY